MAKTTMPATEAAPTAVSEEKNAYECAFHILPTVAEGEVPGVFEEIKALITKTGGEIFDEEAPERVDLAYEIVENIDGKHRKFHSAYFGWVRFRIEGAFLERLVAEIDARSDVLRQLTIRLTMMEEAHPFRYHEARRAQRTVTINEDEVIGEAKTEKEIPAEVSEKALDESLEKITTDKGVSDDIKDK